MLPFQCRNTFRPNQQNTATPSTGRFTIVKTLTIGDGGCNGGIHICKDNTSNTYVIKKKLLGDDVRKGYAEREISALKQLKHPNINGLIDAYVDMRALKGTIYLEYCDRGTILDLIQKHAAQGRRIPERFLLRVLHGAAEAIRYMHYGPSMKPGGNWNLLVHRDLKPANVFLMSSSSGFPRAVLGDFGCCASVNLIREGKVDAFRCERQDPRFAPPEAPAYYVTSDMFQIGLILCCMSRLVKSVDRKYMVGRSTPLGGEYGNEINDMVSKCLLRDPDSRIRSSELCSRLGRAKQMGKMDGREGELLLPSGRVTETNNRRRHTEHRGLEPTRRRTLGGFEFPDIFGGREGRGGHGGRGERAGAGGRGGIFDSDDTFSPRGRRGVGLFDDDEVFGPRGGRGGGIFDDDDFFGGHGGHRGIGGRGGGFPF